MSVLLAFVGAAAAWGGYVYWDISERIKPAHEEAEAIAAALTPPEVASARDSHEPIWVLLLGSDARPGESAARADSIILARLDPDNKKVTMLSVPRDTRVQIPGHGINKLNAATAYGGSALMIRTLQELTGLPIDHYLKIDFEGFKQGVDAMGGIRMDIERSIYDPQAADHVKSASRIDSGAQIDDGAKALTFVRGHARSGEACTRIRNQQKFLSEFISQAVEPSKITQLPNIASSVATHLDTDMSVRELVDLAQMFKGMDHDSMVGYTIPSSTGTIGGVSYVLPDEKALEALVDAIKRGETPDEDGLGGEGLDFGIAVVNATDVKGAAGRLATSLERRGFKVERVTSGAPAATSGRSVVLYRNATHVEEAQLVAHVLGEWPVVIDSSSISSQADVVVVVGVSATGNYRDQVPEE